MVFVPFVPGSGGSELTQQDHMATRWQREPSVLAADPCFCDMLPSGKKKVMIKYKFTFPGADELSPQSKVREKKSMPGLWEKELEKAK